MLSLIRMWLDAGVMEDGRETKLLSGTPQGGVISPLLSNIYLSFLDERWTKQCSQFGTLVRYADDFVIVCNTRADLEEAERRLKLIFKRLRLHLHPDKTRNVELTEGKQGFTSSDVTCTSACLAGSGRTNANAFTSSSAGRRQTA